MDCKPVVAKRGFFNIKKSRYLGMNFKKMFYLKNFIFVYTVWLTES